MDSRLNKGLGNPTGQGYDRPYSGTSRMQYIISISSKFRDPRSMAELGGENPKPYMSCRVGLRASG